MARVIIVGAGQAGAQVAIRLRNSGFEGEITMLGAEPLPPYQRPPLSKKYLLGDAEVERLFIRPKSFYGEMNIDLRLGVSVSAISPKDNLITVDDEQMAYDHLVLTLGSAPRRLPAAIGGTLKGVFVMRDVADADTMAPELIQGRRVLIVGGGYIGLEAAAVARMRGLDVTLVEKAERILQRVACPETASYFRALHGNQGVSLREGVGLERLEASDGRVSGAVLDDGTRLACDFVIVGVGIAPEIGLAEAAGIEIDNGIAANEFGHTSVPNIWTAGDCASFPYAGGRLRLESVQNAIDQADNVAENIMGSQKPYHPYPWFWSDQYDVKLQIAGLNTGYDRVIIRDTGNAVSHWYFARHQLISVDAMNDPRAYMIGKRLIEAGKTADTTVIADGTSDLKALMRS